MRLALAALTAAVLAAACSPGVYSDLAACLTPATPGSPGEASIPALVDRADVIVLAEVVRAAPTNTTGNYDAQGARRVTLRSKRIAKGDAPAEFVVLDGPCPMLLATPGESLIAFLEANTVGSGLKPVGLPTSALRATPARSLVTLMAEISATRPLDGEARRLLEQSGWTVTAKRDVTEFDMPALSQFGLAARGIRGADASLREPFERYAVLSAAVGLDPRPYAGRRAELLTFWLERKPPEYAEGTPFGHILIADRRLAGAWITVFPEGGPFSLRERAAALASPYVRRSFPPANRVPQGVNIAQAYRLAETRMIAFKTGGGGNGQITDPARIRAFVTALDVTLSTTQAVWDPTVKATKYYLHFDSGTGYVSLEYDSEDGVLTVAMDGFAVRPSQAFVALVADLR